MRTYGQPSGQIFLKRWPLSNLNLTKSIIKKHKVKHHRNSDSIQATETTQEPPPWNGQK